MDLTEDEQPEVGLPAEAIFAALLESQTGLAPEQPPVLSRQQVTLPERRAVPESADAITAPAAPSAEVPLPANAFLLKGPAAALARNMDASLAIPTATTFRELPVQILEARRAELNRHLKRAGRPEKLSFTHLIAWALVQAVKQFPMMGTGVMKVGSESYRLVPKHINLGLAVDVERKDGSRGLMVPVLRTADTMAFGDFFSAYEGLVAQARANKLMPDDFVGATMTLTNPGGLGTVASVPRLMPGQGTIFATGAIAYPPEYAALDAAAIRALGIVKVMMITSTYDHRVIQGAESGNCLRLVDQFLQGEYDFYQGIFSSFGMAAAPAATALPATAATPVANGPPPAAPANASEAQLRQVAAGMGLIKAFRTHGHLAARLDPLGTPPVGDPALDPATLGLTPEAMAAIPAEVLRIAVPGATLAEALPHLQVTYCGTIAYEVEHIASHEQRGWLREQIESGAHRQPLSAEEQRAVLERLTQVEGLERFLGKAYLGAKRFSIEGLDMLVPMLDLTIELAAEAGARDVVLGMAHRGRLNVLVHTIGRPYESLFAEFEGGKQLADGMIDDGATGDVKYHLGAEGAFITRGGKAITVALLNNPSHLEFIGPVVDGRARAAQTNRRGREVHVDASAALPVIIHGDAAFPGQGVVAETLNLGELDGYRTGGTVHLIGNNQIGFTTDPRDARSTRWASDLAKGFDIPIIHVNANEPEACLAAVRLAMAYRVKFREDVLIDLVGYRRHGHNETDEPGYTQPVMYARIKQLPTVRQLFAERLVAAGVLAADEPDTMVSRTYDHFVETQTSFRSSLGRSGPVVEPARDLGVAGEIDTALPAEMIASLNEQLLTWPAGFTVHPKLVRQLEKRRSALTAPYGIDWGHAEGLAFASLLVEGTPIRFTGQDVGRGTFSHRHMVLHDAVTGAVFAPVQSLPGASAPIEVHNSPLSELAAIGFEYGYATAALETLVVWEAQFGDFVNGAQVMIDQFLVSSLSKWGVTSRLTLLLPHGYEGQGPEHSSARIERFLQSAAEGNIRVVNCSTAGQYFHVLRRQAKWSVRRPLIVMTPKSLLRASAASCSLADLASGRFETVLDDPSLQGRSPVSRTLILCTGKVYYDLVEAAAKGDEERPPIVRIEQLYPFPEREVKELLSRYPTVTDVIWVQEEPRNMGAWSFIEPRLRTILHTGVRLHYVGRPERASPAEGYKAAHDAEQARIVAEALGQK